MSNFNSTLTVDRLHYLFNYDPKTGYLICRNKWCKKIAVGDFVGTIHKSGYIRLTIDGESHALHRIAWFYFYGDWPNGQVDHVNGIRSDNSIANLRDVTQSINQQNQKGKQKGNVSGFLGVSPMRENWCARINIDGEKIYLGTFTRPEDAYAAYLTAKRKHHRGCTI